MKKKTLFFPILLLSLSLSACGGSGSSYDPKEEGDGYVDVLPESLNDGVLLQAFDWTFNQIKDNLAAIRDAGFKGVQTSPVQTPKSGGAVWYFFYQPVSFTIAASSPLGTKEELIELCSEAEKYGIDIVVDVVFNHLATTGAKDAQGLAIVDPEVATYEPEIYNHQDLYFHHSPNGSVTQYYAGLPDLNTGNEYVQERALSFLKECIDAGVDGFRFDAAKHIETPEDASTPSDFWPNTLGVAKEYCKEQNNGKELFAYGEILNDLDGGRKNLSSYTKYMKVTDNGYIGNVNKGTSSDASQIVSADYTKSTTADNLVTWVESHDTYIDESSHSAEKKLSKNWAVVASRKDTVPMFFARCDEKQTIGQIYSYDFEKELYGAANRFHNRFIGAEEYLSSDGNVFVNERVSSSDEGAVLVNVRASQGLKLDVKLPHLKDGYYFDQITNRQFKVSNHKASIYFHETGVCVITKTNNSNRPSITNEVRSCSFIKDFKTKITVENAKKATYQIDNNAPVSFSNSVTLDINKSMSLTIYAENGSLSMTRIYNYEKFGDIIDGYFNVINLKPAYITDYELYLWTWTNNGSSYSHEYTWNEEHKILLISNAERWTGFLLAIFAKGTHVSGNTWKNPIKQSGDIDPSAGYYDASNF